MHLVSKILKSLSLFVLACACALPVYAEPFQLLSTISPSSGPIAGGSGDAFAPIVSADGRYVLFASTANNLCVNSNNVPFSDLYPPPLNVFLRDRTNQTTILVSVNLAGHGGNGDSIPGALSTNGRYALFESSASDLVTGDTNNAADIFIRDLVAGTTTLVSIGTNGEFANGASQEAVMTPDARYVAFSSSASNLVVGDTNSIPDVFVRDLQTQTTTLASPGAVRTSGGVPLSTNHSDSPQITPDGRYVVFNSTASNLVAGVPTAPEIYVRDLVAGTTLLASVDAHTIMQSVTGSSNAFSCNHVISTNGQFVAYEIASTVATQGIIARYNLSSGLTDIVYTNADLLHAHYDDFHSLDMSPDGRFIVFVATTNSVTDGTNTQVRLWDSQTASTILVSANLSNSASSDAIFFWPTLDDSGRYVAFYSTATNLTTNLVTSDPHLYVRDVLAGTTKLVDVALDGTGSFASPATFPNLTPDGRFLAFDSSSGNHVPNDDHHDSSVFIRNLTTDVTELISARHPALPSQTANGSSSISSTAMSTNGRYAVFASDADNLVSGDTNGYRDVFVCDLLSGINTLLSMDTNGLPGTGTSTDASISADGRFVAFTSGADNLVAGDANQTQDVFVRDLQSATTSLISVNTNGTTSGNAPSYSPTISADGRFVVFRSQATNLTTGPFSSKIENLFQRDLQSAATHALTTLGVSLVVVTPDGRFVAFGGSLTNIYVWDSVSAALVFTNSIVASSLAISPNGQWLAYSVSTVHQLLVTNRITHSNLTIGVTPTISGASPRFSGDGRYLTYVSATNGINQISLYDFQTGTNLLITQASGSAGLANSNSDSPAISADGRFVAYCSFASNLVPNDTNGLPDIFLYDRLTAATTLLSVNAAGTSSGNNRSLKPIFSGDGQTLLLQSWASDLVANDFNRWGDVLALKLFSSNSVSTFVGQIIFGGSPGQSPTITWPAVLGKSYQVQFKNSLSDASWQPVNGNITIEGNQGYVTDLSPGSGKRFYRILSF